jgi:uncharacterized Tic20 family protein
MWKTGTEDHAMNDDFRLNDDDDTGRAARLTDPAGAGSDARRAYATAEEDYDPIPHEPIPGERKARRFDVPARRAAAWTVESVRPGYGMRQPSEDERLWAAIAHASAWITVFGGIVSIGAIVPVSIFIPLAIYFFFRKRSDFIADHALQAFVLQLIGTVGVALLFAVGSVVWIVGFIIGIVAMLVLVGFFLVPVWLIIGLVLAFGVGMLPVLMVIFATIAAIETFRGKDYRYPVVGNLLNNAIPGAPQRYI